MSLNSEVNEGMSIAQLMRGMFRRKLLIIVPPLVGLALGAAFLAVNKPRYLSEAQVIIESQFTTFDKAVGPADGNQGTGPLSDRAVSSQVSALKSEDIAARVVDQLGLDKNPEFNANLRSASILGKIAIALGFKDDPALYTAKALAEKTLAADLTIYPIPESNVIGIKSIAGDPTISAAAANAIAETYVLSTREAGASTTDRAREWLAKQIDGLRAKVAESDQAVERYRADAGLIRGASATLGTQQISELNTQIGIAQNAKIEAQTKADSIQRMLKARGDVNSSAEILASPSLQRLKDEQILAARDMTSLSATYLPSHPKMIAAQNHLNAVNNQIKVEAQRVVDSLQAQALSADERANSLNNELNKLKTDQTKANFSDVRLQALQREAEANRTLLQSMLGRYADANARQDTSLQPGYARIIQKAVAPAAPYFPKVGPTLLLAGFAGLLLGLGLAFVLEVMAQPLLAGLTARRREPLAEAVEQPHQVTPRLEVPTQTAENVVVAPPAPQPVQVEIPAAATTIGAATMLSTLATGAPSELRDQTDRIAQNLELLSIEKGMKTFACAVIGNQTQNSAMTVIAIARNLAAKGKRVMLVDLAVQGASAEMLLGLPAGPGLSDLVAGKADFTKSVVRDTHSKMHFVRLGTLSGAVKEDLILSRLPAIVAALRTVYDMIIFNIGDARASAVQVMVSSDANLLLAAKSRIGEAASAAKAIEEAGNSTTMLLALNTEVPPALKTKAS